LQLSLFDSIIYSHEILAFENRQKKRDMPAIAFRGHAAAIPYSHASDIHLKCVEGVFMRAKTFQLFYTMRCWHSC
jgi:hypothetical protein